ncbi:MAG: PD40 domain-containing protein [Actinobacteria bacterium]|nr:PD40 domain-containing protein [Actinomycetota bacterium]
MTVVALAFALFGIHVGSHHTVPVGYAPAWSPNAERIAYVTRGDVWVGDADGTHRSLLVRAADQPAWGPNGRRLAFVRDGWVWTVRADGLDERKLARGAHPDWAPDGARVAFDRDGETYTALWWYGAAQKDAGAGVEPAYAPDGRLAVVQDDQIVVAGRVVAQGDDPDWSADGRLAWVRDGIIYIAGKPYRRGLQPAWPPARRAREILPDFDQRAPTGLVIQRNGSRWLLGMTSLVDNLGPGSSVLVGERSPGQPRMTGTQRVRLANGATRVYKGIAQFRYTNSPPHHHWHLMRFDSFELHTLAGQTLVRDRKSGFCLADHWGAAPGSYPGRHPVFLGDCDQFHPEALHVTMGTSPGYTDRYPAFFHGQNIDITGIPPGVYVLVHRVNSTMMLREFRYENDAASVRIRIGRDGTTPTVRVLRTCQATTTC